MKKISESQFSAFETAIANIARIDNALKALSESIADQINDVIETTVTEEGETLGDLIGSLHDHFSIAGEIAAESFGKIDDYMEERSEKWLDSDKGQAFADWHSQLESAYDYYSDPDCRLALAIEPVDLKSPEVLVVYELEPFENMPTSEPEDV